MSYEVVKGIKALDKEKTLFEINYAISNLSPLTFKKEIVDISEIKIIRYYINGNFHAGYKKDTYKNKYFYIAELIRIIFDIEMDDEKISDSDIEKTMNFYKKRDKEKRYYPIFIKNNEDLYIYKNMNIYTIDNDNDKIKHYIKRNLKPLDFIQASIFINKSNLFVDKFQIGVLDYKFETVLNKKTVSENIKNDYKFF